MMQRCQQIGFTLKILDNRFAHERVGGAIDHFLHCHQLGHIWKVHVTRAIYRPHTAKPYNFLNRIPIGEGYPSLKLTGSRIALAALIIR